MTLYSVTTRMLSIIAYTARIIAHCTAVPCVPGQQAMKLSSSIALNSDESAIIQKLSLNIHTIGHEINPVLFVIHPSRECGRQQW